MSENENRKPTNGLDVDETRSDEDKMESADDIDERESLFSKLISKSKKINTKLLNAKLMSRIKSNIRSNETDYDAVDEVNNEVEKEVVVNNVNNVNNDVEKDLIKKINEEKKLQEDIKYWKSHYLDAHGELTNLKQDFEKTHKESKEKDQLVKKAQEDMEYWRNQYHQSYADMANLRKDIEKDNQEIKKYRIEGFVEELTRTLDAFDMALKVKPKNQETENFLTGFKYIYNQLLDTLRKEGVEVIEPKVGDRFDENVMHCVEIVEDEGEDNLIKEVSTKGYKLYDHLIKAAMVVVTKHVDVATVSKSATEEVKKPKDSEEHTHPKGNKKSGSKQTSNKKGSTNKKQSSNKSNSNKKSSIKKTGSKSTGSNKTSAEDTKTTNQTEKIEIA